jgi:hypothetical protein
MDAVLSKFRGMTELEVRKLLSHGDEYCEVYVHGIG